MTTSVLYIFIVLGRVYVRLDAKNRFMKHYIFSYFKDKMKRPDCYYGKNCRTQKHNLDHCKYVVFILYFNDDIIL